MTNRTYNSLWQSTQKDLMTLLQGEPLEDPAPFEQDRTVAVQKTSNLYLKYIQITNKLIECYENILQPQKRCLLEKLVDNCIGRVLELKHELVALEFSEFTFLDDKLLDMKLVPSQADIKIPSYFYDKTDEEKKKLMLIQELIQFYKEQTSLSGKIITNQRRLAIKEAVNLIYCHEQTRQGRLLFNEAQKLYEIKQENRLKELRKNFKIQISENLAATRIQRAWRWFSFHKNFKSIHRAEMNLLGMQPSVTENKENFHALQLLENLKRDRLNIIKKNEWDFFDAKKLIKKELETFIAPKLMEDLQDKIRAYFEQYRQKYGEYPVFPTDDEGGSDLLLKNTLQEENEIEKPKSESGAKEKVTLSKRGNKALKEDDEFVGYSLKISKYVPDLLLLSEEYQKVWADREIMDFFDKYDEEMIRHEAMKEMESAVKLHTDKIMREELHRLTEAFEKDLGKKGRKGGKKGGKKDKGKGKGKGKKEKDLTPNRSFESLVEELVKNDIIKQYPKFYLNDFVGDFNYVGSMQDLEGDSEKDPVPCLRDIRRVVNEYCILPMGSPTIHSKGAFVKSVLFAGPPGCGKKSLIYAICNEIGATLMDLSAENVNGKYPGKEGLDMLMHLIAKVGRLAQPTVVYIKDAENYFWKKQPTTSVLAEAVRLRKEFPKFIKGIGNDDRIIVCGTTITPFDVDLKGLSSCYSKVMCIFKLDHNCRRALWREMILKHKGVITPELGLSTLCSVSDGFTAPHIKDCVLKVLTERRLAHQAKFPLHAVEFVHFLSNHIPITQGDNEEYRVWLSKMPLQKKRLRVLKEETGEVNEEQKLKEPVKSKD